ncbi:1-phosphofructokinase [Renibacterium salmoninarum ATCC 33209]|uniref:1-phosphofructokinase n=1 Tax=Renibacterium salmoninarum (strain ATCC 33209 / DSM 20767 / JCM 11484 / NBRC 15589 / NCIMB 2235) TaxID=288705 RepID=A9WUI8_RENSM|nr:1-phosphofructokinase family hexose kinase [Renibacterium salmoninarum]ABY24859.1 1-phosphofructokinase [Renibacterium salmoninarum ATCC 33209]
MIVTLTPNPSLDRTIELGMPLARGEVQRAAAAQQQPGGKGVNIARALTASDVDCLALLPGSAEDAVLVALRSQGIAHLGLPISAALRSNVTITEPDGTTTKVNEPGPTLNLQQQADLISLTVQHAREADWLVLAGSLPPGVANDFYAQLIRVVRQELGAQAPLIAVDSSGAPFAEAVKAQPDLIKPNSEELAELTGADASQLEANPELAAQIAQDLVAAGVGAVLVTLGAKGAVLASPQGAWFAQSPKVVARSTVGAGDSALAGYLLAQVQNEPEQRCVQQAVAHGAAAAALPGSSVPALVQTQPDSITVIALTSKENS